jgi:hypothetical protein
MFQISAWMSALEGSYDGHIRSLQVIEEIGVPAGAATEQVAIKTGQPGSHQAPRLESIDCVWGVSRCFIIFSISLLFTW